MDAFLNACIIGAMNAFWLWYFTDEMRRYSNTDER